MFLWLNAFFFVFLILKVLSCSSYYNLNSSFFMPVEITTMFIFVQLNFLVSNSFLSLLKFLLEIHLYHSICLQSSIFDIF